jgi:hypothetical protein
MKKNWFVAIVVAAMIFCFGTANAIDHTRFVSGVQTPEPPQSGDYIISNTLYFSDLQTTGPSTVGFLAGVSRGQTVSLLKIPADTIVKDMGIYIKSAWSNAGTGATCAGVQIGDSSDTDGWFTEVDFGHTASGVSTSSGCTGYYTFIAESSGVSQMVRPEYFKPGGKYYTADTNIYATLPSTQHGTAANGAWYSGGLTDFQLTIWAECVKPSTQPRYKRKGY